MRRIPRLGLVAGLWGWCAATPGASPAAQALLPPGVGIRLTHEGPVFVDAKGMTLYTTRDTSAVCNERPEKLLRRASSEGALDFDVPVPDFQNRRGCAQKHPPLLAPQNAQPVGHWTLSSREGGLKQWAYDGEPLYRSIKDKAPGDVNGSRIVENLSQLGRRNGWKLATAPLPGMPAGMSARKTWIGVALTTTSGQTLYFPERATDSVDVRVWHPVPAPSLARTTDLPDWSVVTLGGKSQWAYRGKPLYTYADDANSIMAQSRLLADVFGSTYGEPMAGWHVALLKAAPAHPSEVTIRAIVDDMFDNVERSTLWKKIYADHQGMTLYVIQCIENTAEPVDCDDVGDSPSYWLNFCGGETRCAKTWRPLVAPADAKPIDATWSTLDINPHHPWKPLEPGSRGVHVWAYHGRPVFTFAKDARAGDINGAVHSFATGQLIYARQLMAAEKR